MSFTDRNRSIIIGTGSLMTGTLTKGDEEPTINNEGWDSLRITFFKRVATLTAEDAAGMFPIGAQLGSRKWWVSGAVPVQIAPGFFKIVVDHKGWAATKPAKITVGSNANQQGGSNIRAPRYVGDTVGAIYAKAETHEPMPDITVSYLVANVDAEDQTEKVGTAVTPPVTITVPPTVWDFLTEYVYHWPNGWVLMGSAQDRLPGSPAALVTDSYQFIREKTPG